MIPKLRGCKYIKVSVSINVPNKKKNRKVDNTRKMCIFTVENSEKDEEYCIIYDIGMHFFV